MTTTILATLAKWSNGLDIDGDFDAVLDQKDAWLAELGPNDISPLLDVLGMLPASLEDQDMDAEDIYFEAVEALDALSGTHSAAILPQLEQLANLEHARIPVCDIVHSMNDGQGVGILVKMYHSQTLNDEEVAAVACALGSNPCANGLQLLQTIKRKHDSNPAIKREVDAALASISSSF